MSKNGFGKQEKDANGKFLGKKDRSLPQMSTKGLEK
jgi:hypothetical protein